MLDGSYDRRIVADVETHHQLPLTSLDLRHNVTRVLHLPQLCMIMSLMSMLCWPASLSHLKIPSVAHSPCYPRLAVVG
jgi:hypothetical protein